MAVQYTVQIPETGSAVVFQQGDQNPGVTVKCLGESEIWLAQTSAVDESNAYILSPGSSVIWEAGKVLYLGGPLGGRAFVSDNSGSLFDASAVASAMIQQDLAGEIAQRINIEGIPPIRQSSIPIPEFSFTTDNSPANLDGTKLYQTDWFEARKADVLHLRGGVPDAPKEATRRENLPYLNESSARELGDAIFRQTKFSRMAEVWIRVGPN